MNLFSRDGYLRSTVIRDWLDRVPYVGHLRKRVRRAGQYDAGHFYSPIPASEEVTARLESIESRRLELPDIRLNKEKQFETLMALQAFYAEVPFPENPTAAFRYYYNQSSFCYADAIFLYSFLRHVKPRRIIEVGSGFSSCVILDTVERFFDFRPEITLIEPYPALLRNRLRSGDENTVKVIEKKVQTVPVSTFSSLQSGDLLFIDSSHVMKCGSDLQFLLFEVLPRLPVGVFVHFHDLLRNFEYPRGWLEQGWYWNEMYVLRALLAYNDVWEIYFFNDYVDSVFREYISEKMPLCRKNPGGSLYLRRNRTWEQT